MIKPKRLHQPEQTPGAERLKVLLFLSPAAGQRTCREAETWQQWQKTNLDNNRNSLQNTQNEINK